MVPAFSDYGTSSQTVGTRNEADCGVVDEGGEDGAGGREGECAIAKYREPVKYL